MTITVHRSLVVLERRNYQMTYSQWSFSPLACEDRRASLEGWRHYRMASTPLLIDVPFGSRVVTVQRPDIPPTKTSPGWPGGPEERLSVFWAPYSAPFGMDAETAVGLARRGERVFTIVEREGVAA